MEKACGSITLRGEYEELEGNIREINSKILSLTQVQRNQKKEDLKIKSLSEQNEKYSKILGEIEKVEGKIEVSKFYFLQIEIERNLGELKVNNEELELENENKKKMQIQI